MVRGGSPIQVTELGDGVVLDWAGDALVRGERRVTLTQREMQIVEALAQAAGAVVPTEEMMRRVWATEARNTDALRTHIRAIRAKLTAIGARDVIEHLPRRGYRLRTE
jgi:DNA-binding winged helix-turn-helix (wHTH) protein